MSDTRLIKDYKELFAGDLSWIKVFDNSSILVTGATGLIGSVLCRAILFYNRFYNGQIRLIAQVRNIEKAKKIYCDDFNNQNLEFCISDINDGIQYSGDVDYIVHCANTTSSQAYVKEPVETINTIVLGTNHMLSFAKQKNVKCFVYLSTMETYGNPFLLSVHLI